MSSRAADVMGGVLELQSRVGVVDYRVLLQMVVERPAHMCHAC